MARLKTGGGRLIRPRLLPKQEKPAPENERALQRLVKLVDRHRLSVPFPLAPMAFVKSLLPGLVTAGVAPEKIDNLNMACNWGTLVHVTLDNPDCVIWVKLPEPMPVPQEAFHAFRLWPKHEHWNAVSAWYEQATRVANEIDNVKEGLTEFFKVIVTAAELRVAWPDLQKFVRLRGPMLAHIPDGHRKAIDQMTRDTATPSFKEAAIRLLTSATLLEESEPSVWLSYNHE